MITLFPLLCFISLSRLSPAPDASVSKDDQWLGVSVRSQGKGGYVMVGVELMARCRHLDADAAASLSLSLSVCDRPARIVTS